MRALARVAAIVALAGAALSVASQLLEGPARYVVVSGASMEPSLRTGDLVVVVRHGSYRRGDVVAYRVPDGEPGAGAVVIHRVIGGSGQAGYVTQGDNREGRDTWQPKSEDVIGALAFQIPRAGLVPMSLGTPMGLGLGAGLFAFFLLRGGSRARPTDRPAVEEPARAASSPVPAVTESRAPTARTNRSPLVLAAVVLAVGGLILLAARRRADR